MATGGTPADALIDTGGLEAVGGSGGGGGISSAGSTTSGGGVTGTGGAIPTGGVSSAGGTTSTGGVTGTGGTTSTGGVTDTGGTTSTGGVTGTGGTTSTGGVTGTGGTGTGGATATGGAPGTGGTTTPRYTLTVAFANTASAGTVTLSPGNTTCVAPTACTQSFDAGTTVILTAKPINTGATVTSILTGWTGACSGNGPSRTCKLTMNDATGTTVHFEALGANLAFVSSATYAGNLGSALAYQTRCNAQATAAGINNATNDAYIAWIAASNYSPINLIGASRGWVRMDMLPWIDDLAAAFSTGAVFYPVAYDEDGERVIDFTLAGMNGDGALDAQNNCGDWSGSGQNMSTGATHAAGKGWPNHNVGVSDCTNAFHLICLMKGRNTPVSVTPAAGKKIYLSRSGWAPGGGLASADAKCAADAPAGVASAKAVLVASNRSLASVLNPSTVYVRPDGVKAGTGADIAAAFGAWSAPATIEGSVVQDGSGKYIDVAGMSLTWTGVPWGGTPDTDTCRDWTATASTASASTGCTVTGWFYTGSCAQRACDYNSSGYTAIGLYCAEQ
jgi:hypothetical protein